MAMHASSEPVTGPYPGGRTLPENPKYSVLFLCEGYDRAWGDELCAPYYILQDNGVLVNFACRLGGSIPITAFHGGAFTKRFRDDNEAMEASTRAISLEKTEALGFNGIIYDAVYIPGGPDMGSHKWARIILQSMAKYGRLLCLMGTALPALAGVTSAGGKPFACGRTIASPGPAEGSEAFRATLEGASWSENACVQDGNLITAACPEHAAGVEVEVGKRMLEHVAPAHEREKLYEEYCRMVGKDPEGPRGQG